MDRDRDRGQITVLLLGFILVGVALILVVSGATSVHLARHRLLGIADIAALDAADALDRDRYYAGPDGAGQGPDQVIALTDGSVRASVEDYLADAPARSAFDEVVIADLTGAPDGFTAQVSLSTRVRLPLLATVLGDRARVGVTVIARARTRQVRDAVSHPVRGGVPSGARATVNAGARRAGQRSLLWR